MPKIRSITYTLDGGKQVFRPGETVSGSWIIDVGESFTLRDIRLALEGIAYTCWSPIDVKKDDKISKENITKEWRTMFGKKSGECRPNPSLSAGVHKYRFSFQLPKDGLPSSYEAEYGAIRYWLRLQIDLLLPRSKIDRYKVITVLDNIDVNTPELSKFVGRICIEKISKAPGIGDLGSVTLHGQTDRGGYCPGEKIAISLMAKNESDEDLGVIKASLIQKTKFVASDDEKTTKTILRTVTGTSLLKKTKKTLGDQLQIDAIPPSTHGRTCHIITVSYYLRVYVDIPLLQGAEIVLRIPVIIGTIPQGYQKPAEANSASHFSEVDLASVVTYTECNRGFGIFKKSGSEFPKLAYNPWCAYVHNFQFKKIQKSAVVGETQGATASPKPAPSAAAASSKKPKTTASPTPRPSTLPQRPQAGPLPSKSGPPPVSFVVPATLPTETDVYREPSTPPMELLPSSDKESVSVLARIFAKQPKEETVPESTISSDDKVEPARKTTFVILRFSDNFLVQLRTKLKGTKEMLRSFRGEVIALAPQVMVDNGTWPSRISVAVFLFETKDGGKQWFEKFHTQCKGSNIEIMDSVLGDTREEYRTGKSTFVLHLLGTISTDYESRDWKRYSILEEKQLTPSRKEIGGVVLASTNLLTHLQGTWPNTKLFITLVQWDSIIQYHKYKKEMQNDKYSELLEFWKKFYSSETQVFFQTEDLNFLEDALSNSALS